MITLVNEVLSRYSILNVEVSFGALFSIRLFGLSPLTFFHPNTVFLNKLNRAVTILYLCLVMSPSKDARPRRSRLDRPCDSCVSHS